LPFNLIHVFLFLSDENVSTGEKSTIPMRRSNIKREEKRKKKNEQTNRSIFDWLK
jgi:hypothetical protein